MTTRYRFRTTSGPKWGLLKPAARNNRKEPTPAEDALWQRLRNTALGHRFRRQHAIDRFIVDFVCLSKNLVIELDGGVHDDPQQQGYDAERTGYLNAQGFHVIRFRNEQVLNGMDSVVAEISDHLGD